MKWLNYTRMSLWEAGTRRAHELFMGVYHSHSIQIARLIERAHSFARPPSPPRDPPYVSPSSFASPDGSARRRSEERPRNASIPISASTNEFSHRIADLVFPRKQIGGPDRPCYRRENDILRAEFAPARCILSLFPKRKFRRGEKSRGILASSRRLADV